LIVLVLGRPDSVLSSYQLPELEPVQRLVNKLTKQYELQTDELAA